MTHSALGLTFISALTLAGTCLPATAANNTDNTRFETVITISKTLPVEATYASLEAQVRTACREELRTQKSRSIRTDFTRSCTNELLDSAIANSGRAQLVAHHKAVKTPATRNLYAGKTQ